MASDTGNGADPDRRDGPQPRPGRVRGTGVGLPQGPRQHPHQKQRTAPDRHHDGRQGRHGSRHHRRGLRRDGRTAAGHRGRGRHQRVLLPAAARDGRIPRCRPIDGPRRQRPGPGADQRRADDRPLRHRLPARPRRAGGLPAGTPTVAGLHLAASAVVRPGQAVLERPGDPPPWNRFAALGARRRGRVETPDRKEDDPQQELRRAGRRGRVPAVGPRDQLPGDGAGLLPRPRAVGDGRPDPLGCVGRPMPHPGRGDVAEKGPLPP